MLLVLGSWTEAYEQLLDLHDGPIAARWHSPLLQTELSREGWKLARMLDLLEAGRLTAVAVSDAGVAAALDRRGVVHLPEVFDEDEFADVEPAQVDGVNVSLFGEPRGRKNLLAQSAAFAIASRGAPDGERWTLHLAGQTRRAPGYQRWLELAGVSYVDHGRLPRRDYLALAAAMDTSLAATVSESFGYVAAEAICLGVPAVISRAVACADGGALEVGDPGDVEELTRALQRALAQPELAAVARRSLHERARANAERARVGMSDLLAVASA
jgi:glycosyltransferase involved in cell wall biosynthesis